MKDIETRQDVEFLIDEFYKKVIKDEQIGFFFTEVVKLDWDKHIPVMYDFWESILFGKAVYKGNPMIKHMELNKRSSLSQSHFDRWLALWSQTVQEYFTGVRATETTERARQIAGLMLHKIKDQ